MKIQPVPSQGNPTARQVAHGHEGILRWSRISGRRAFGEGLFVEPLPFTATRRQDTQLETTRR